MSPPWRRYRGVGDVNARIRRALVLLSLLVPLTLAGGCSTPIGVWRSDGDGADRLLTGNVLSTGEISSFSENALRLRGVSVEDTGDAAAMAAMHEAAGAAGFQPDDLFALGELAFQQAERKHSQSHFLSAAVYAYAFLFPDPPGQEPNPFDPRLRWAADIYNRAVTAAFAAEDGAAFEPRAGDFELPFGTLSVAFDEAQLEWSGRRLIQLAPMADLHIRGIRNRYRIPGIGAPLAAGTKVEAVGQTGFQVAPRVKIPVAALLRIKDARAGLRDGRIEASLELHPASSGDTVQIGSRDIPLEVEPSATLAYGLSDPDIWSTGLRGFLIGNLLQSSPTRMVALQPYMPGRIPVIFVHGTASVAARWAEMINDLTSDPAIRNHFQFWFFSYESGNPIPYSAMLLRDALAEALHKLDPAGADPALRQAVVIGHSQGGLLAKMVAISTGTAMWDRFSAKPIDDLSVSDDTRELLRKMLFVEPAPSVRRVIFVATPQHGSYIAGWSIAQLAGRLVKLPLTIVAGAGELLKLKPDELRLEPSGGTLRIGSVYGMTPNSPLIEALSAIPLAPSINAHSIIAVEGDGPIETGGDGVVKYESAHIEGVASEFVVRSGHSCQAHPQTIAEVRRILLVHLADVCRASDASCSAASSSAPLLAAQ
jgi:pimeloyl-ACP methyl ester carboxylesterase